MGTTLAEKVWADHLVRKGSDGAPDLLYIDLMLMHEVTSPQAFEGLRLAGRKPRRPADCHGRPQHADRRHRPSESGRDFGAPAEHAGKELQGFRRASVPARRR